MTRFKNRIIGSGDYPLDQIQFNPRNWRVHPLNQQNALKGVLDEVGWVQEVIVNQRTGNLIDGHLRCQLAAREGATTIPVKFVDLSEDEEALVLSTLDPIAAMATTDKQKLDELFASIDTENADVLKMLDDIAEKERLEYAKKDPVDAETHIDRAAELNEKWQVVTGDLWQIGEHRLLCGDSTKREDVERVMAGEKALVYSDPPYGVSIVSTDKAQRATESDGTFGFVGAGGIVAVNAYAPIIGDDTTETAEKFYQVCIDIGLTDFILWGGNYFTEFLPPSPCWLIWDKREEIPSNNFADCEIAWASFQRPSRIYKQLWSGLLRKGDRRFEGERRMHPTQKPVELQTKIMADFPANIYFDGFLGSGSFMVAAQNVGKKMYGIEKSKDYCAVILERMSTAFPEMEIKRV